MMGEYNPFSLKDKTILVTGASSGIGQATSVACSRLGAKLVLTGRHAERLQATFDRLEGTGHRQIPADLTVAEDLGKLVAACPALNGLVLCAGVNRILPFKLCDGKAFDGVLGVNCAAPMELLRLLLKGRKVGEGGSVVFVSSVAALPGGGAPGNAAYSASKAALVAAMRCLVREFVAQRLRFNAVSPGTVNTPLVQGIRAKLSSEQIAADLGRYPLGRYGEPDDVAHGIVYLLSDASSWVTGQQLVIDGGLTA